MTLSIALVVDILLLLSSLWAILQISERSIFNPSLWYVALHAYAVTFRLVLLNLGAEPGWITGIRSDMELVNAAIASDISLLAVVAATGWAAHRASRVVDIGLRGSNPARLSPAIGTVIAILCVTIGTYAAIKFGGVAMAARERGIDVSAVDIGDFEMSSVPRIVAAFAVQGALILCAMRGFTRWRVVLLLALLALCAINLARTFFVLPVLMAVLIYQTMHREHKLSAQWWVTLAALGVLWFVFKPIRQGIQKGEDPGKVWANASAYFEDSLRNPSGDTQLLDLQATYMAAADEAGKRFYGTTVLSVVYLPIPRFVWPDKPRLNDYAVELTSSSRALVREGLTPNLSGEAYLNFGWTGCAVIPFFYILGMQMAYRRVRNQGIMSPARWVYLLFLVCMVQVFRDGLDALVLYPFVDYLPLFSWGLISMLLPAHRARGSHLKTLNVAQAVNRTSH